MPMTAHTPIGQRLAFALESRLRRRRGRLDRIELALVHSVAAGTGWTTDWRVRALVEGLRGAEAAAAKPTPAPGLRIIDRGELPAGRALDQLWRWVLDTSLLHRLPGPLLTERIVFCDAAPVATVEVIRHRVLRSAAVLDRLPVSLEVKLGRRRDSACDPTCDSACDPTCDPAGGPAAEPSPQPARIAPEAPAVHPAAAIPIVRLIARFPAREGASGETRVLVWESARGPELVALLRECARRFDPRSAAPEPPLSAPPSDRK